jgi:hypothetical protein
MVAVDGERLITGRAGEGWRKGTGREEREERFGKGKSRVNKERKRDEIWERKELCHSFLHSFIAVNAV